MGNSKTKYKSPLRYPGGKGCIYEFMTHLLVENDMVGIRYAEPYAGGAGLALGLLMDEYVSEIYINDLDPSIYSFWWTVLNRPDDLISWIEEVEISIDEWKKCKEIQKSYKTVDVVDLAKATFFLNRTNVSGVLSGGVIGGLEQKGKYKIDARFNKEELIARIKRIMQFSHRIHLSNQDGVLFIKEMNKVKEDMFIYLDPPYYKKGADLYLNAFKDLDHKNLTVAVGDIRKFWMVSYDNQPFILDLYEKYNKVLYQLSQCASNRIGDEVIIFDPQIQYNDSLRYLSQPIRL